MANLPKRDEDVPILMTSPTLMDPAKPDCFELMTYKEPKESPFGASGNLS